MHLSAGDDSTIRFTIAIRVSNVKKRNTEGVIFREAKYEKW